MDIEEDEEVLDSWEDAADSGELERRMDRRVEKHRQEVAMATQSADKSTKESSSTTSSSTSSSAVFTAEGVRHTLVQENDERTPYVPQIRLLKRPQNEKGEGASSQAAAPAKPSKTLAEREAEYAEKRARIMGTASNSKAAKSPSNNSSRS